MFPITAQTGRRRPLTQRHASLIDHLHHLFHGSQWIFTTLFPQPTPTQLSLVTNSNVGLLAEPLLEAIKMAIKFTETVIVITSDRAKTFNEFGDTSHNVSTLSDTVRDFLAHVPA